MVLNSPIYGEFPGMIFTDLNNDRIKVGQITLDPNTQEISSLEGIYEETIDPATTLYQKYILNIPGVGNVAPGTRVIWKGKDYCLRFGWHTNISNQELYTWYLESLEETCPPKTLYKPMINEIDLVHFR